MQNFNFYIPKKPEKALGPIEKFGEKEALVDWLAVFGNEDRNIDFRNSKIIGRGAFGAVRLIGQNADRYAVKYIDLDEFEIIPDMKPNETRSNAFIRQIKREFDMQRLAGTIIGIDGEPITPRIYAAGVFQKPNNILSAVFVMDYLGDHVKLLTQFKDTIGIKYDEFYFDFTKEFRHHALSLKTVIKSIASQFEYIYNTLHEKGILHRDLHTANIVLKLRGEELPVVKIIDFGLSIPKENFLESDDVLYEREDRKGKIVLEKLKFALQSLEDYEQTSKRGRFEYL